MAKVLKSAEVGVKGRVEAVMPKSIWPVIIPLILPLIQKLLENCGKDKTGREVKAAAVMARRPFGRRGAFLRGRVMDIVGEAAPDLSPAEARGLASCCIDHCAEADESEVQAALDEIDWSLI